MDSQIKKVIQTMGEIAQLLDDCNWPDKAQWFRWKSELLAKAPLGSEGLGPVFNEYVRSRE